MSAAPARRSIVLLVATVRVHCDAPATADNLKRVKAPGAEMLHAPCESVAHLRCVRYALSQSKGEAGG
jgi:hypothetical protein